MGSLIKIAIVDDSYEDAQHIQNYLEQFQKEHDMQLQVQVFYASFDFLEEYRGQYDVIFLDIEMPGSDGLAVAREIRTEDEAVGIIFVTSLAQYAIEGYEVNAIDFMVKPIGYYNFSVKLEKAFRFYQNRSDRTILIQSKGSVRKVRISDVIYIEKVRDDLMFHTAAGSFSERGSMKTLKEKLQGLFFEECTSGCLVNLEYISVLDKDSVTLTEGTTVPLSRRLKKAFTQKYIAYVGGGA